MRRLVEFGAVVLVFKITSPHFRNKLLRSFFGSWVTFTSLFLNIHWQIALACNVERYRTTSSEKMAAITLMMQVGKKREFEK